MARLHQSTAIGIGSKQARGDSPLSRNEPDLVYAAGARLAKLIDEQRPAVGSSIPEHSRERTTRIAAVGQTYDPHTRSRHNRESALLLAKLLLERISPRLKRGRLARSG